MKPLALLDGTEAVKTVVVEIRRCHCVRCSYEWTPKDQERLPKKCPECWDRNWHKPYTYEAEGLDRRRTGKKKLRSMSMSMSKESVEQEMDEELGARTQRGELFEVDTSEYTRVEHKGLIQFVKMLPCSANDGRLQGAWKIVDHRERMVTMFQTDGRDQAEEWINRRKVQG